MIISSKLTYYSVGVPCVLSAIVSAIPISHNLMDDEGRTSDGPYDSIDVLPFIPKKRRVCDLTEGDVEVLLHTLEEFELQLEDILEDLPINFSSGIQQLRKMLENAQVGDEVHLFEMSNSMSADFVFH